MREVNGMVAVVTGAGTGVGAAIARALAKRGASVVLAGRRTAPLERVRDEVQLAGGTAVPFPADVANRESVMRLRDYVVGQFGPPAVLVNNAGLHGQFTSIRESDPDRWVATMMVNAVGPYVVTRAFLPAMLALAWGRIVNITSASSLGPPSGMNSAYPLSKVTLNHFTRQLAAELAGTGLTANVLHPGEVRTEMWAAIRDDASARSVEGALEWARLVDESGGDPPGKAAERVLELLEPEQDAVNGEFLWVRDPIQKPRRAW